MSKSSQPEEPEWLAKPPGDCCLKGHLHAGSPQGIFARLNDIETYISYPPTDKANGNAVLYYPDVCGLFTNGLLVCDEFAAAGYLTIAIDYFQGDPIYLHRNSMKESKEGFDFEAWKAKYQKFAEENVPSWIDAVRQKYGKAGMKYACVGYCFGAPYVMNSLTPNGSSPPVCEVGALLWIDCSDCGSAHPAFLKEHHFQNVERPLFLSCAEVDHTFGTEQRNKSIDILREGGKAYHLQLFSGVEHGFALRCDLSKPYARWCKEQSAKGITEYFDLHLGIFDDKSKDASKL